MDRQPHSPHHTRSLTLPSGRQIEVVYYESGAARTNRDAPDLRLCGGCGSDLVQPVEWSPVSASYWSVTLRCPNCEWSGTGVFEQELLDRYDDDLGRGAALLAETAQSMAMDNMAQSLERFVAALHAGHVLPSDF